jgi:hypothetical protein
MQQAAVHALARTIKPNTRDTLISLRMMDGIEKGAPCHKDE